MYFFYNISIILIIKLELEWKEKNREHFEEKLNKLKEFSNIINYLNDKIILEFIII